jgi:hypothetical protein
LGPVELTRPYLPLEPFRSQPILVIGPFSFDETKNLTFLPAALVPKPDPAATLLSDTSCGVPCTHNHCSLCAFAASFWRCSEVIICSAAVVIIGRSIFIALDPCGKRRAPHERTAAKMHSRDGKTARHTTCDDV